jgi:hypothetical protein
MNTTNTDYKAVYTSIIKETADKINDQLNNWYVKREDKWNKKYPTYPYAGDRKVIFLGFNVELKEGEDLSNKYPTAIINVTVRTRRTYRGDSLFEEKHFPATQIEFNLKSGLGGLHNKLIHIFGIGPNCRLLKNMEKYKNINNDIKNLKEKIEDLEQAIKIADHPEFKSDCYRNYFHNFEENIIHTMYHCETVEEAVRLYKRGYFDGQQIMKDNDFIILTIENLFSVTDGDKFNQDRAFFWKELQESRRELRFLQSIIDTF